MTVIPFFLVTGFLGSGKTTFLKHFLNTFADERKIAVIQNEFAAANVDAQELKNTGKKFEILEINKGSVFCVCLLSDFKSSLKDLVETCRPDAVILEATGLADPIAIGQMLMAEELQQKLFLSHVWCVIDTTTFLKMETIVTRITHQVRIADTVILNKTDLVSSEKTVNVAERIIVLNPDANIVKTRFCDLPIRYAFKNNEEHPVAINIRDQLFGIVPGGQPQISSAVLRTTVLMSRENLEIFLEQFKDKAFRIKGTANLSDETTVFVQCCFGQSKLTTVEKAPGPTELIALGPGINYDDFAYSFKQLAVDH